MKFDFSSFYKKNSTAVVFSVLLSVACWFVVVSSISPSDDKRVQNVPVEINLPVTSNLNVVDGGDTTVTVEVVGMRYNIGNLTPQDVILRANIADVTKPGKYRLSIEAVPPANDRYQVIGVYPDYIEVTFDRVLSKDIVIEQHIAGIEVNEDFNLLGDITIEPGMVTVAGPEAEVAKIERAVVSAAYQEPLSETQNLTLPIIFLDAEGNEVKTKQTGGGHITTNYETTTVTIPVMDISQLPLTLSFINIPDEFPIERLSYHLSNKYIRVAAPEEVLRRYYEISVGHVDLSLLDLTQNSSVTFDLELPESMINYDKIESVVAEFDADNLASKSVKLTDITTRNVPPEYNVDIKTTILPNVKLVGDKTALTSLPAKSIVAEIDFSTQEITTGQYQMPINIYVPTGDFVWVIGRYQAVVNVTEK